MMLLTQDMIMESSHLLHSSWRKYYIIYHNNLHIILLLFFFIISGCRRDASVYVGNIPNNWSIQTVFQEFEHFGAISSINMRYYNHFSTAFVEFCAME